MDIVYKRILYRTISIGSYSEELSRCRAEMRQLQESVATAREECVGVSDDRLQLQQENQQLRKEMDDLRKATLLVQKKAKQQVIVCRDRRNNGFSYYNSQ